MNKKLVIPIKSGKAVSILEVLAKRKEEMWAKVEELMPFKTSSTTTNFIKTAKKSCE